MPELDTFIEMPDGVRLAATLYLPETDGPWPYKGEFQGRATEPWLAARVVEMIGKLKGVPFEEATIQTGANTCDFFAV